MSNLLTINQIQVVQTDRNCHYLVHKVFRQETYFMVAKIVSLPNFSILLYNLLILSWFKVQWVL